MSKVPPALLAGLVAIQGSDGQDNENWMTSYTVAGLATLISGFCLVGYAIDGGVGLPELTPLVLLFVGSLIAMALAEGNLSRDKGSGQKTKKGA